MTQAKEEKNNTNIIIGVVVAIFVILALFLYYVSYAASIVSALASVALVIVTIGLILATRTYTQVASQQAEAMNKQAAALTDPVVIFGVEEVLYSEHFYVENVGPGMAYDVKFTIIKDFESAMLVNGPKLSDVAFLKQALKTLAPGQKQPFAVIDPAHNNTLSKETIEVEVSYKNSLGVEDSIEKRFPIDFAYVEGTIPERETALYQLRKIADSLEKINGKLKKS